jgi:hypothetical protein
VDTNEPILVKLGVKIMPLGTCAAWYISTVLTLSSWELVRGDTFLEKDAIFIKVYFQESGK